jgi:hypothetical protein
MLECEPDVWDSSDERSSGIRRHPEVPPSLPPMTDVQGGFELANKGL